MGTMRTFSSSAYFAYFALYSWINPPMWLVSKLAFPIGQMAFFTILGGYVATSKGLPTAPTITFIALGNALQSVCWSTVFALSNTTGSEKWQGTLSYLLVTPANRLGLFLGRSVLYVLDGLLTVIVSLAFAALLFGVNFASASLPAVTATILITSFSMSGFGLMLAGFAFYLRQSIVIANIFTFIVLLFSGVNFPIESLPPTLRPISYTIPLTYGENVIHGFGDVTLNLIYDAVSGVILMLIGFVIFRYFERAAREKGFLEIA